MNILLITYVGKQAVGHYIEQIKSALEERHRVSIIVPTQINLDNSNASSIYRFYFPDNLIKAMVQSINPFLYRNLLNEISRIRPDVVHLLFELRVPFFFILLLRKKFPIVATIHEPVPIEHSLFRNLFFNRIQSINMNLIARFCDKIIVHGENHRTLLVKAGIPSSKIGIIPHGDFSFLSFPTTNTTIETNSNCVLFFGRIASYKGISYLIRAGKILREKISGRLNIIIAGEGDFSKYDALIGDDPIFTIINRFINNIEVGELFAKASVIVLPYTEGSQSGIISIAYAFKKPVIATAVGNLPDMVINEKTGILIDPGNEHSLADAIFRLLNDANLRNAMGNNGYEFMKTHMSWKNISEQTVNIYNESIFLHNNITSQNNKRDKTKGFE